MKRRMLQQAAAGVYLVLGVDYMLRGMRLVQQLQAPPPPTIDLVVVGSRDGNPPDVGGFTGLPTPAPDPETTA